jgi:hypothetical protein
MEQMNGDSLQSLQSSSTYFDNLNWNEKIMVEWQQTTFFALESGFSKAELKEILFDTPQFFSTTQPRLAMELVQTWLHFLRLVMEQKIENSEDLSEIVTTSKILISSRPEVLESFLWTYLRMAALNKTSWLTELCVTLRAWVNIKDSDLKAFLKGTINLLHEAPISSPFMEQFFQVARHNTHINFNAFSLGQIASKKRLLSRLQFHDHEVIYLIGGWYGMLADLILFQNHGKSLKVRSFDVDGNANEIAEKLNNHWVKKDWSFKTCTLNAHDLNYTRPSFVVKKHNGETQELNDVPDWVINTSCEHIENFSEWWEKIPRGTHVALQSNNAFEYEDHINCHRNLEEFQKQAPLSQVDFADTLELDSYKRFTLIGTK